MTTELRKELEQQYAQAAKAAAEPSSALSSGTNASSFEEAPRSYKKEFAVLFKTLPPAMRKYIHERESEIERGFSRLNNELSNLRWLQEAFSSRAKRLERQGICKAQDWVETMAKVDDALEQNPEQALQSLAASYGFSFNIATAIEDNFKVFEERLDSLDNKLSDFIKQYLAHTKEAAQVAECQKAHEASFAPKGKNSAKDLSKLSTREILELKLAEYED